MRFPMSLHIKGWDGELIPIQGINITFSARDIDALERGGRVWFEMRYAPKVLPQVTAYPLKPELGGTPFSISRSKVLAPFSTWGEKVSVSGGGQQLRAVISRDDANRLEAVSGKAPVVNLSSLAYDLSSRMMDSVKAAVIEELRKRGHGEDDAADLARNGRLMLCHIASSGDDVYALDGEVIFTHYGRREINRSGNTVTLTGYYR
ncbi:hypothetical protein [Aeromonas enteropelogenes]|uniref:hypothetical protein n=1 Tax=Aeromonas enteropelogenes TaxID=29489 RepID=UPI00228570D8|nr:hypothetical protein [Aeromonas enteropelogenes]MCZ0752567.1 hypothetical protein [Aeromonas enteropelogenes]